MHVTLAGEGAFGKSMGGGFGKGNRHFGGFVFAACSLGQEFVAGGRPEMYGDTAVDVPKMIAPTEV